MTYLQFAPPEHFSLSPTYLSDLERTIGVLQQLQVLYSAQGDVSLATVVLSMQQLQREFGPQESLEQVIQSLVAKQLDQQLAVRRLADQCTASIPVQEAMMA